jgi:2-dehydro-3-deoxygluconokinase
MTPVPDVIALGETMLSLIAVGVPLAEASELRVTHGGAESNTCVGLARLGLRAAWVCRRGSDQAGARIASDRGREGVDLRWVRRDPERPTGLMLRGTSGAPARYERAGSAASALSASDLDGVPVEDAGAVITSGITAMLGAVAKAIALLERARGLRGRSEPASRPLLPAPVPLLSRSAGGELAASSGHRRESPSDAATSDRARSS